MHCADADRIEPLEGFLHEGLTPEDLFEAGIPIVLSGDDRYVVGKVGISDQWPFRLSIIFGLLLFIEPILPNWTGHLVLDPIFAESSLHLIIYESPYLGFKALQPIMGGVGTPKGGFILVFFCLRLLWSSDSGKRSITGSRIACHIRCMRFT